MGIILAALDSILLGVSNVLLKRSFRDFSPSIAFFIVALFSIFLWAPVGLLFGVVFSQWLLGVFVGLISAIFGQALYIYVLEKGEVSITATILSSFSIYTILFSILFNHERPTSLTIFFIFLTILGTIIVSLPDKFNKKELKKINLILWAVCVAIGIGASDTLTKWYINKTSVGSFLFFVSFAQFFISFLYLKFDKQPLNQFKEIITRLREYKFALLGSIFIAVSTLLFFLSFNYTLASIASPIAASAPIFTVILAVIFLRDRITLKNMFGIILVLISVITIGIINP